MKPSAGDLVIVPGSAREPEVARLIEALDAFQRPLYPPGSCHLLDLERLQGADIRLFVARAAGATVGCGVLRVDAGFGEVKRMFVDPQARGLGVGRRLLERLEEQARAEGLNCLRLETGVHHVEALRLYRAAGFVERPPFSGYPSDPLSVFMEKSL